MSNSISRIPEVPDEIRVAVSNGTLAVFIGAGVSRLKPINCQGWDELAGNLVRNILLTTESKILFPIFKTIRKR